MMPNKNQGNVRIFCTARLSSPKSKLIEKTQKYRFIGTVVLVVSLLTACMWAESLAGAKPFGAAQKYSLKSPWKKDASRAVIVLSAGKKHTFEMEPFEVLVFDATPL